MAACGVAAPDVCCDIRAFRDLVFVRLGRAETFPPGFQSDLVHKVLAAVKE